jgi:hypothetical protein
MPALFVIGANKSLQHIGIRLQLRYLSLVFSVRRHAQVNGKEAHNKSWAGSTARKQLRQQYQKGISF